MFCLPHKKNPSLHCGCYHLLPAAHKTFSEALTLWSLCPDAWVAWARFCDTRYVTTQLVTWLEYAASCYAQGIRLSTTEAKMLVPRLLQLLMLDQNGSECVGRTLAQQAADLPSWVWLPWIPQLLTSLQRPEMAAARRVLAAAALSYPQLMYWHIRSTMQHLKEIAVQAVSAAKERVSQQALQAQAAAAAGQEKAANAAAGAAADTSLPASMASGTPPNPAGTSAPTADPTSPQIEKPLEVRPFPFFSPAARIDTFQSLTPFNGGHCTQVMAYEAGKEIYESIRARFSIWQPLEAFIVELSGRFTARTDERLLAVIHTLQTRTYKTPLPPSAEVPETFKKELAGVCKACGTKEAAPAAAKQ